MRPIAKLHPVSTPLDGNVEFLGRQLHGPGNAVVQGPRPVYLIVNPCAQIDSFAGAIDAGDVAGVEGLAGPGVYQSTLALGAADTFEHGEVHGADLDGPLDDFDEVRMDPLQTHL